MGEHNEHLVSQKRWAVFIVLFKEGKSSEYIFHSYLDDLDEEEVDASIYSHDNGWAVVRLPDLDRPEGVPVGEAELDRRLARADEMLDMSDSQLASIPAPKMQKAGRP